MEDQAASGLRGTAEVLQTAPIRRFYPQADVRRRLLLRCTPLRSLPVGCAFSVSGRLERIRVLLAPLGAEPAPGCRWDSEPLMLNPNDIIEVEIPERVRQLQAVPHRSESRHL